MSASALGAAALFKRFNSNMVRLDVGCNYFSYLAYILFQFQYGAIRWMYHISNLRR